MKEPALAAEIVRELKKVSNKPVTVKFRKAFDENSIDAVEFAKWIEKKQQISRALTFVIGGPYGFSPKVYERADTKVSLSKMTFSHQMIRLLFVEQIYRACTIIKGEPYHHE